MLAPPCSVLTPNATLISTYLACLFFHSSGPPAMPINSNSNAYIDANTEGLTPTISIALGVLHREYCTGGSASGVVHRE